MSDNNKGWGGFAEDGPFVRGSGLHIGSRQPATKIPPGAYEPETPPVYSNPGATKVAAEEIGPRRSGLLTTAHTPTGDPVLGKLSGHDRLLVKGGGPRGAAMQVSVDEAVDLGLLVRTSDGDYAEPGKGEKSAQGAPGDAEEATADDQDGDGEGRAWLSPESESEIGELLAASDHYIGRGAGREIVTHLLVTGELPADLRVIADRSGVSIDEIGASVGRWTQELAQQADAAARSVGVEDPSAFRRWAERNVSAQTLVELSLSQFFDGDLAGVKSLARRYLASTAARPRAPHRGAQ